VNASVTPVPVGMSSPNAGNGSIIVTARPNENTDITEVSVAERACTVTVYGPGALHVWEAVVVPELSQPEFVPSPHENSYCTGFPRLDVDPLAVYV
jgi:hypothetical protein